MIRGIRGMLANLRCMSPSRAGMPLNLLRGGCHSKPCFFLNMLVMQGFKDYNKTQNSTKKRRYSLNC